MVSDSSSAKTASTLAMARPMEEVRSSGSLADARATPSACVTFMISAKSTVERAKRSVLKNTITSNSARRASIR